ncbi:MAG TPA: asparagine synthase (glutamine-hydrolyzing) [Chitinophagaceae bacterium]|nr:asparagine synthase (glutamine-hydrolyzing) [Chitinophagaceae bacterium]
MCGIAGIVAKDPREAGLSRLQEMTRAIAHRGPDGEQFWTNAGGTVALGHRRLSIIDLSDAAAQPMHYLDRYTLIFNGEIYNYIELRDRLKLFGYTFNSRSDTEVLLALYDHYKEDCLEHVDGMYAFAIYDDRHKTLFCARDRFGEKPFYYFHEPGSIFVFGSEMKALWAGGVAREPSERMLYNYLAFGQLQNPEDASETFYRKIRKLKAAHYLKLDVSTCSITRMEPYWRLGLREPVVSTVEEAGERFADMFRTSVRRRLRSDVPVGSSLSGGIDSSLVVKMIDDIKTGTDQVQKTFSARFPGFLKDEGKYMQLIIDSCNVEPHFTYPDEKMITEDLPTIILHQEEPFASASICAQFAVMRLAKQGGVTVLLDGQGADEILAGYHKYFTDHFTELRKVDRSKYRKEVERYREFHGESRINPVPKRNAKYFARKYAGVAFETARKLRDSYRRLFAPEFNKEFYHSYSADKFPELNGFGSLNESLLSSTVNVGLEQLLRYADRNSMAHSLEVRLPFLYHPLVEFLFSLPGDFKIRDGWTKWIMRMAFRGFLPEEIVWRKDKIGYEPPQDSWMETSKVRELLRQKKQKLVGAGILDKAVLRDNHWANRGGSHKNWIYLMAGSLYD